MMSSAEDSRTLSTSSNSEDEVLLSLGSQNPSQATDQYWIYAENNTSKNNSPPGEDCGKWLIFEPPSKIDKVWGLIKEETEKGLLGFSSKVSTRKDKDERDKLHNNRNYVICVYTYDHSDENDAMRVRDRLQEIGFHRKLPYKTDKATLAGAYVSTTGSRVSKWYC